MLRVLYVSATDRLGGAEASLLTLLTALDRAAVQPVLACPRTSDGAEPEESLARAAERLDVPVIDLPLVRLRRTWNPARAYRYREHCLQMRARIAAAARERGADFIHANSPMAALQADGAPMVCHVRDLSLPRLAAWEIARRVRAFIATSATVEQFVRGRCGGAVHRIANGVSTERFSPGRKGAVSDTPYLLMIGNLVPWKRHHLFLECLARVRASMPNVRGMIAGSDLFDEHGRHVRALKSLASDLGLDYAIDWREHVPFHEMPSLIAGAMVLVHPAEREPFGRAVLEAMSCATPVVAIASGGPEELLKRGGGVLVPSGDVRALAREVIRYVREPARAREDGSQGRCAVLDHYSAEMHARKMESFYHSVADTSVV